MSSKYFLRILILMLNKMNRETSQILSVSFMLTGVFLITATSLTVPGIIFIGLSCWVLMICESLTLSRVQLQMAESLDSFRKRQANEMQDLLYFLRQSQIAGSPFASISGAKNLCKRIEYPAMVVTPHHQIILANSRMHKTLGWKEGGLNGKPAYIINDSVLMSKIGELCAQPEHINKPAVITQYAYIHKSGSIVLGQMDATKIGLEGYFVVFHPLHEYVMSFDEVKNILD